MADETIKFNYDNAWWNTSAVISSSSAEPSLPLSNIQERQKTTMLRFTGDTSEWIKLNLTATAVDMAYLFGHNLTAAATVILEGNASDSWGAPTYQQAMTRSTKYNQYVHIPASTQTFAWWRITFADASNPDGYIEIGVPWMGGKDFEPDGGFKLGSRPLLITNSILNISAGGQASAVRRPSINGFEFNFFATSQAQRLAWDEFREDVQNVKPFAFTQTPWDSQSYVTPEDYSHYVRFSEVPTYSGQYPVENWPIRCAMIEEK